MSRQITHIAIMVRTDEQEELDINLSPEEATAVINLIKEIHGGQIRYIDPIDSTVDCVSCVRNGEQFSSKTCYLCQKSKVFRYWESN